MQADTLFCSTIWGAGGGGGGRGCIPPPYRRVVISQCCFLHGFFTCVISIVGGSALALVGPLVKISGEFPRVRNQTILNKKPVLQPMVLNMTVFGKCVGSFQTP